MKNDVAGFRAGVREWLDSHDLTPDPSAGHSLDAQVAQLSRVRCALYDAGWMRYGWPSKVWTSLAQYSQRCVLLTRTAPGHGGITAFFADMDSPGITIRPLRTMHGVDEFAEVFFDEVVVPSARMLGQPGDGWRLASDLPYERSACFWHRIAYLFTRLDRLLTETGRLGADGVPADRADEAASIGAAYLSAYTARCRSRETQRRLASGGTLGPETSVDKILLQTAEQQLYDTVRDLLPGTIELSDSPWRPEFLYSRAATIYGGTAEIQRNIIARRLLDLGRE
jgi:alkylation response protein AidB-like acyl-CoA dehydrogenase